MVYYLPLEKNLIDTFDFVEDINDFGELSNKVMIFNKYFIIVPDGQIPKLKKEVLQLTSTERSKYETNSLNLLHILDHIEKDSNNSTSFFIHLLKLSKAAKSLPTSSSDVEQVFSDIKLIKTLLRNKLSAEKVEAILLLIQSYGNQRQIIIKKKIIQLI